MPARRRPISADNLKTTRRGDVKRRGLLWRWRRLLFAVRPRRPSSAVAGAGYVVSQIELPTEVPDRGPDHVHLRVRRRSGPVHRGARRSPPSTARRTGSTSASTRCPTWSINAVISAEDRDFFEHGGVDPVGITRAALSDIRGNSASRQGGSTITQQYVKNVYLSNERTLDRKIREAVMAIKLEQEIPKEQILENYLNTIYFGRGAYGIQAAAQAYFGKDVGEVSLPEAALLAGLIRSPQSAEPYRVPGGGPPAPAHRPRRHAPGGLHHRGRSATSPTPGSSTSSTGWPCGPRPTASRSTRPRSNVGADYFVEYVRKQLTERYGDDAVFGGGLRVYTTIDMAAQDEAYQAVVQTLDQPDDPAGALVSIDDNGQVRRHDGRPRLLADQVNLALGHAGRRRRSPAGLDVQGLRPGRGDPRGLLGRVRWSRRPSVEGLRERRRRRRLGGRAGAAAAAPPRSSRRPPARPTPPSPS